MDWIAGACAGALMLAFRNWLAGLYALPRDLLLVVGIANLVYASGSFTLDRMRRGDHVPHLRVLAAANVAWACVCAVLAWKWFGTATVFGMTQLVGEAILVGALGMLEWRAAR